ncbi:S24/S26 family peptidase [Candidatus Binatus soli]|uniref:S24/S26 family peptidase n=1 Tax=Candidatus Binatus soli TaxID=1953413 RepID=UPI003D1062E9
MHTAGEVFLTGDQAAGSRQPQLDRIGCEIVADCLRAGREVRLRVAGSSMLPAIWPKDVLLVRPKADSQLFEGEVVVFARDGRLITHRVARRLDAEGHRLLTRGDSSRAFDLPVEAHDVLGTVSAIYRSGREMQVHRAGPSGAGGLLAFALRHTPDRIRELLLRFHALRRRLATWTPWGTDAVASGE